MAGGHKVYGVFVSPGTGYRDDSTAGVATGSQPQGAYMVASGTHVNSGCCFDYGNAETSAWTTPAPTPRTERNSSCGPVTAAPTSTGPCPERAPAGNPPGLTRGSARLIVDRCARS